MTAADRDREIGLLVKELTEFRKSLELLRLSMLSSHYDHIDSRLWEAVSYTDQALTALSNARGVRNVWRDVHGEPGPQQHQ